MNHQAHINIDLNDPAQAQLWLAQKLLEGRKKFFMEVVEITPTLAKLVLEVCNKNNRKYVPSRGELHASRILQGRFLLTSQGISFSKTGELNNGQHRLNGIVIANKAVELSVTFGELAEAKDVIDTVAPRTGADSLGLAQFQNVVCLAATARLLMAIENGPGTRTAVKVDNDQLRAWVVANPSIHAVVSVGHSLGWQLKASPAGVSAAAYRISQKHDLKLVTTWLGQVGLGLNISSTRSPEHRLRQALGNLKKGSTQGFHVAARVIKAWNLRQQNKNSDALGWREDEAFPTVL